MNTENFESITDVLDARASAEPERVGYAYLNNGDQLAEKLTYAELRRRVQVVSSALVARGAQSQRVAIVVVPGLDFLTAFLGCLRAGSVAVPLAPPRRAADLERLFAIAQDAACVALLTQTAVYEQRSYGLAHHAPFDAMPHIAVDTLAPDCVVEEEPRARVSRSQLAYLQYTSGSTSTPKGVMITHGNLLANCEAIRRHARVSEATVGVTWLPHFHDMGLVSGYMLPLYAGFCCYVMPPAAFVQKPIRWLKALSDYRATFSVGPNFAYDLCVRSTTEEERATLRLDAWATAFNGAEPVRADTVRSFEKAFAPCGFSARAALGAYGLAEATLMVSGSPQHAGSKIARFQPEALRHGRALDATEGEIAQSLVSCGRAVHDTRIQIVNPETRQACAERTVGEIWVTGNAVSTGYFGRDHDNPANFAARIADREASEPYLRTGDLGFLLDDELYVTGRIKDLVILAGRNHYPQDLEQTTCEAHAALAPSAAAAFSIERSDREVLIVVAELHRRAARNVDGPGIAAAIRKAISSRHDIDVEEVVLIRPSSLYRTSSGKVQRQRCRSAFLEQTLHEVFRDSRKSKSQPTHAQPRRAIGSPHEVERWILDWIARRVGADGQMLDADETFQELGLDSVRTVAMTGELCEHFGVAFSETVAWDHPTPHALAAQAHAASKNATIVTVRSQCPPSHEGPSPAIPVEARMLSDEPNRVALVGLSCRFPGAPNSEALWRVLTAGECTVTSLPLDRMQDASSDFRDSAFGGFLPAVAAFDAGYFGISAREAAAMDPQQRWLLELVSEALEDAGLVFDDAMRARTGVFVGLSTHDYLRVGERLGVDAAADLYATTGTAPSVAAGRISYQFGLRGPSLTIDTACSSSLVAVHLAERSLRAGECDVAIVAAANAVLLPDIGRAFHRSGMLAKDGRCKTFDAAADGYVRSEGCAAVILRRLADARRAGDRVRAVLRGSAINHDGASNGLTAPSRIAQREVIASALTAAGVSAGDVSYLEAHGTGTPLGDPIEVAAINDVFAQTPRADACRVGSIKTNLGHLEAAAGLAGLIKVVLALEARKFPPHLHFTAANPRLDLSAVPLRIATELEDWPDSGRPRLAGVSSFGISGTNAHVLVEESAPQTRELPVPMSNPGTPPLLLVSAASSIALTSQARAWSSFMQSRSAAELRSACIHSAVRRQALPYRLAIVANQASDYRAALEAHLQATPHPELCTGNGTRATKIAFVFPGQGGQWAGMGRDLFAREEAFRGALERADQAIRSVAGWSVIELLLAPPAPDEFARAALVQPTTFAIQVGLCALLESWGVRPAAVVGHSMGEVAGAYIAGALSLEDAARVVCERSRLVARVEGIGRMAMIDLPAAALEPIVASSSGTLAIAAENGPRATLIAGDTRAVLETVAQLEAQSVFCRLVDVQYASHSPHMLELVEPLECALTGIDPRRVTIEMFSTVSGRALADERLDAGYWVRNLCERVRFAGAVRNALSAGCDLLLEIGPHPVLKSALRELARETRGPCAVVATLARDVPDRHAMSRTLAELHVHGVAIDWRRIHGEQLPAWRGELPRYSWDHAQYWWSEEVARAGVEPCSGSEPTEWRLRPCALRAGALQRDVELSCEKTPRWAQHRVAGVALLSAADQLQLMIESASAALQSPLALRDVTFEQRVPVPEQGETGLQLVLERGLAGSMQTPEIACYALDGGEVEPLRVSRARVEVVPQYPGQDAELDRAKLEAIAARCTTPMSSSALYMSLAGSGLDYGSSYRRVVDVRFAGHEALARVQELPQGEAFAPLLDGCFHAAGVLLTNRTAGDRPFVPASIARVCIDPERAHGVSYSHLTLVDIAVDSARLSIELLDAEGRLVGCVTDLTLKALPALRRQTSAPGAEWLHALRWIEAERLTSSAGERRSSVLVVGPSDGIAMPLTAAIAATGGVVRHLPTDAAGWDVSLQEQLRTSQPTLAVVLTDSAEPDHAVAAPNGLLARQRRLVLDVQAALRAITQTKSRHKPKLWCLTRGVFALGDHAMQQQPTAAVLWGVVRSLRFEHPELGFGCVDLSVKHDASELAALALELTAEHAEQELALRGQARFVARLRADASGLASRRLKPPARNSAFRLEASPSGRLEDLVVREVSCTGVPPRSVKVAIEAAGMNFRDVLIALNTLDTNDQTLGFEFVGRISALGEAVDDLTVGDRVLGIAAGTFGAFTVADRRLVLKYPAELTPVQAATLPIAQLSAYYSLAHVAKLARGERVLVHAASGGVGLATLQWARHVGADVIATAGSERKRAYLRELGVEHVFDSRTLAFADAVREITRGEGVDVVLNSLSGPLLTASLELLRAQGRFIELGRRDYEADARVGLRPFLRGLTLSFVDVRALCAERPALIAQLLGEVVSLVERGVLAPLPAEVFPLAQARDAFFRMARAEHIGKLVLTPKPEPQMEAAADSPLFEATASYFISGGLGGLGLAFARHIAAQGVKHLVLASRSAPGADALGTVCELRERGVDVQIAAVDVSDRSQLEHLFARFGRDLPPLKGVFHLAGALADCMFLEAHPDLFDAVLASKALGAWHLAQLCEALPLDQFVLFSSAAGLLGSPGQAVYAGANAFLDALAASRRSRGLPALSIDWGTFSHVGLAAEGEHRGARLAQRGVASLEPEEGFAMLDRLLRANPPAHVGVLKLNARHLLEFYPAAAASPMFSELVAASASRPESHEACAREWRAQLRSLPAFDQHAKLASVIWTELCAVLRLNTKVVRLDTPFKELGLDSLMALELRNRLEDALGTPLSAATLWRHSTARKLAGGLLQSLGVADVSLAPLPQEPPTVPRLSDLGDTGLTDAQALRLIERVAGLEEGADR